MKVLVLGGTRYFGKRLVDLLLGEGHAVTVATRSTAKIDRGDATALRALAASASWDIVFDQVCYSPNDAAIACEAFEGRVKRYVHTSTASVYTIDGVRSESDFDPFSYPIRMGVREDFEYGEGKRLAEAVYFQRASFPVTALRIPIVLGPDDYTGRVEFHIERIRSGRPIVVPNLAAETAFIHSSEAAEFLLWLGKNDFTGPINAASDGRVSIGTLIDEISSRVGHPPVIRPSGEPEDETPLTGLTSLLLSTRRAEALGFHFSKISNWLPPLLDEVCARP